ncbi:MAG: YabP/YqfC family sporulation protein [Lachnospiraceae bacterium]
MAFIMDREENYSSFKEKVVQMSSMPRDVVLGAPIVTIVGQEEIRIENYRGIIEYTNTFIRIQTKVGQIKILGSSLQIQYYTNDEMKIIGHFSTLEYS